MKYIARITALAVALSMSIAPCVFAEEQMPDMGAENQVVAEETQDALAEALTEETKDPLAEALTEETKDTPAEALIEETPAEEVACQVLDPDEIADIVAEEDGDADYDADGSKYQTKRLIVMAAELTEDYDAEEVLKYDGLDYYLLTFGTVKDTKAACKAITKDLGEGKCFADEITTEENVTAIDSLDYPKVNGTSNTVTYSWATDYMGMNKLKDKVKSGSNTVTVAVLDTGIDPKNWMFEGKTITDSSYDYVTGLAGKANMKDPDGHGTGVAGVIADATPANVKIMALRVIGTATSSYIAAFNRAIENGADVINCSFMLGEEGCIDEVLKKAYDKNIPVIFSAGNAGDAGEEFLFYPARSEYTVAVGSIDDKGERSTFSCYGDTLDFVAPGENVVTAKSGAHYGEFSAEYGTSISTPAMSAAYAYLKLAYPSHTNAQLYDKMKGFCTDLGDSGKDIYYGYGVPKISGLSSAAAFCSHTFTYTSKSDGTHSKKCTKCGRKITEKCQTYKAYASGKITCSKCKYVLKSKISNASLTIAAGDKSFVSMRGLVKACMANQETYINDKIIVESGYTHLEPYFCTYCNAKTLKLPSTLTEFTAYSCYLATTLESINLQNTKVTYVGDHAAAINNIPKIEFPRTLTEVGDSAFISSDVTTVDLSRTKVTKIGNGAFEDNRKMTGVYLPSTLKSIGYLAFAQNPKLTYVDMSKTKLTEVAMDLFSYCDNLKTVYFPKTFKTIGSRTFDFCYNLRKVYFLGDYPRFNYVEMYGTGVFNDISPTVYYPEGNDTWDGDPDDLQGTGTVTWKSFNPAKNVITATVSVNYNTTGYKSGSFKPAVTVKNSAGTVLKKDNDYTVSYSVAKANTAGTITITGKGSYSGIKKVRYIVKPSKAGISTLTPKTKKLTVKMANKASYYGATGFQISYKKSTASTWKTIKTTAQTKTITGLATGSKYSVKVRAYKSTEGTTYYGAYSAAKTSAKVK